MPVKIALIGCGQIVQGVHLPILASLPDVVVTALAEPDATRRAQAQQRVPAAKALAKWEDALTLAEVDAVIISLPTGLHARAAIAAFEAGKHGYLEKPIATSVDDGAAVVEAWRRSNLVGMIGFNYRFNPLLLAAKRQIESGRIGKLVSVRSVFSASAASVPPWKQSRATGGGVLLDLASHHVDLVRYLLGAEIADVSASIRTVRHAEDTATVDMRLSSGVLVQSFHSLASIEEDRWDFFGTEGKLSVDRYASLDVEFTPTLRTYGRAKRVLGILKTASKAPYILRKMISAGGEPSYRAALSHFADAMARRVAASPNLEDGLKSLAVIEAAEESARSGQRVEVSSALVTSAEASYARPAGQ
jgi:myo-inositol 2-dehydrogenase/D-chiro-inositol 1-dehydrogenase